MHEGGGVERRAAHHERERQRRQREAAGGSTEPAAEEATDVEAVSAADVLAGVEESGPNYALPTAREGQRERRERLREIMAQQIDLLEGIYRIALDNFAEG